LEPAGSAAAADCSFGRGRTAGDPDHATASGKSVTKTLFDRKTLRGWHGNPDWWSVKDGAIVGKFHDKVPTSFLFTDDNYSDFRLTLSSRMVESDNHAGANAVGHRHASFERDAEGNSERHKEATRPERKMRWNTLQDSSPRSENL
jgi:hypothetical protein